MSDIETRLRESFGRQTMMQTLGARLVTAGNGEARIEAPILESCRQQHGYGHAGLSFSIGDTAAGYAALSVMPEGSEVLTAEIKMNLLAPARGDRLVASARVVKAGRRLVVVTAEVTSEEEGRTRSIALLQGTMIPVPPEEAAASGEASALRSTGSS